MKNKNKSPANIKQSELGLQDRISDEEYHTQATVTVSIEREEMRNDVVLS